MGDSKPRAGSGTPLITEDKIGLLKRKMLHKCQSRLSSLNSPVTADREISDAYERQVSGVVDDLLESLRQGVVVINEDSIAEARALGSLLLARNISPIEFLGAGSEIVEAIFDVLAEGVEHNMNVISADPDYLRLWTAAIRALNRSTSERAKLISEWHDLILLDRTREIQRADRRRMARDIHDSIGNEIGLAIRYLDLYDMYRDGDKAQAANNIVKVREVMADVMHGIRAMASNMRVEPPTASLEYALKTFVHIFDASDMVFNVSLQGDEARLPGEYRNELFLIMREALRNIFTHAHAHRVTVLLQIALDKVSAVIEDDGTGLGAEVNPLSRNAHGLASMRERTELLGGEITISNCVPHGTRIEFFLPLQEDNYDWHGQN